MKTLILSSMVICFTVLLSWGASAVPEESLVLYLPADEKTGDTTKDLSPNNHTATLVGTGVAWANVGRYGGGLEFKGFKGHINVADHPSLSVDGEESGDFTIMAWVFPKVVDKDFRTVIDKTYIKGGVIAWDNQPTYRLMVTNKNRLAFQARTAGPTGQGPEIKANKWYHFAGVQNEKKGKKRILYIDGVEQEVIDLEPKILKEQETDLKIGARNWVGGGAQQFFNGIIDEIAIFKAALTEKEIRDSMKGLRRFFSVNASGKLALTWAEIKAGK